MRLPKEVHMLDRLTIVLVHGAFADSSSWAPVTARLIGKDYAVRVPAVPNRSLRTDAAYIRSVVEQIPGPVLLAGHSYGGAVITVAGAAENVVGLVYVSAYALEAGETAAELQGRFPDSELPPHLVLSTYPTGGGELGTDVLVDVDAYPGVIAAGVPRNDARVLAVSQRAIAAAAFDEPAATAAWRTTPSWGIVSSADRSLNPEVQRFGYRRAGMRAVVEIAASHMVTLTHSAEVAEVIAVAALAGEPVHTGS